MKRKILALFVIGILGYNAVYFKTLSEINAEESLGFNFQAYADSLYYQGILKKEIATDLNLLQNQIEVNKDSAFLAYGNRLGIGNTAYFMVKAEGKVLTKNEAGFILKTELGDEIEVDTKFIFGNAIRDASGLVKLTDFKTNSEFNKVSEALNEVIREKALPEIIEQVRPGDQLAVEGALKLSKKEQLPLKIVPVKIYSN